MPRRIVDLTLTISEQTVVFPSHWHPKVEVTVLGRHASEGRETRRIVLGTHTGTHCDAPRHFVSGGKTIDELPLDGFIGPARVLDLSDVPPCQAVDLPELQRRLGGVCPERLLLRFDWSDHYREPDYYTDYPFLTMEAARWLAEEGILLLGMDSPSPDNPADSRGTERDSPVHKLLLAHGVILLEYLTNLRELTTDEPQLVALPLKVAEGDGAPARCVAIEDVED